MLNFKDNFIFFNKVFVCLINISYYLFTKKIKKQKQCLLENNVKLDYKSLKIIIIKYVSLLSITLIILNYFIPLHSVIIKIPLLSSIYTTIILVLLIVKTYNINSSISILNNQNGFKCLTNLKFKFSNLLLKYKYKISLSYIFLSYLAIIY